MSSKNNWRELIEIEQKKGRSITEIAKDIGYARASLSLALTGKYIGGTERIEQKIIEVFGSVDCPYFSHEIAQAECVAYSQREAPTQNPTGMRHWRLCQNCPNNCRAKEKNHG